VDGEAVAEHQQVAGRDPVADVGLPDVVVALVGQQDDVDRMVVEFRARRDLVVDGLNAIDGVRCLAPGGAFYAFPRVDVPGMSSRQVADALLAEDGVALLAGTAFGAHGEGFLRISFATSMEELAEGLARIKRGVERLRRSSA